ncbi:hypothetical protein GGS23DRAFT_593207 [Durotheca rogersii]|uniref:uncharacterized protein n=1 Tax=Durotheca rogersii TaxID=419775 RepID=UPI0022202FC5|nr:uncharacterized protein GGS23DRAFT_593207 [Durotheca rogersii]KAI5866460.1 hypothetical protein GGS23DRAFT_593207 [Durotheca rogersii]
MQQPQPQPQPQQLPFGLVAAGQPVVTEPASRPSETSFLYQVPWSGASSGGGSGSGSSSAPASSHLAVFLLPGVVLPAGTAAAIYLGADPARFRFLGGVGPGKESAVFKVEAPAADGGLVVGVSLEDAASVAARIQELRSSSSSSTPAPAPAPNNTLLLAQRIIQNAFNFLSGFSGAVGPAGVEVVPLRAFQDWWRRFESKVRADPSFLERDQD